MKDIWKQFDQVRPGHRSLHHLMAVHFLTKRNGEANLIDIAKYLNISKPNVSTTMKKLKDTGYVFEDDRRRYRLNTKGINIINTVLAKRQVVELFFKEVLGMSPLDALSDACKVEHLLSQKAIDRLTALVGLLKGGSNASQDFSNELKNSFYDCNPGKQCEGCMLECCFAIPCSNKEKLAI